jgi:hypothetical protein
MKKTSLAVTMVRWCEGGVNQLQFGFTWPVSQPNIHGTSFLETFPRARPNWAETIIKLKNSKSVMILVVRLASSSIGVSFRLEGKGS